MIWSETGLLAASEWAVDHGPACKFLCLLIFYLIAGPGLDSSFSASLQFLFLSHSDNRPCSQNTKYRNLIQGRYECERRNCDADADVHPSFFGPELSQ